MVLQLLREVSDACPAGAPAEQLPGPRVGGVPQLLLAKAAVYHSVAAGSYDLHDYLDYRAWLGSTLLQARGLGRAGACRGRAGVACWGGVRAWGRGRAGAGLSERQPGYTEYSPCCMRLSEGAAPDSWDWRPQGPAPPRTPLAARSMPPVSSPHANAGAAGRAARGAGAARRCGHCGGRVDPQAPARGPAAAVQGAAGPAVLRRHVSRGAAGEQLLAPPLRACVGCGWAWRSGGMVRARCTVRRGPHQLRTLASPAAGSWRCLAWPRCTCWWRTGALRRRSLPRWWGTPWGCSASCWARRASWTRRRRWAPGLLGAGALPGCSSRRLAWGGLAVK